MNVLKDRTDWKLLRIVVPAYAEVNIYTRRTKQTTALGPIMVATTVSKMPGWRVEVIDENNYRGPCDEDGFPDHEALQREAPAHVVGFYCGLTSTIERVYQLAHWYHKQDVVTLAGGWHAHYCPSEALNAGIDVVVHGDGDEVVPMLLRAVQNSMPLLCVPSVSYRENDSVKRTAPEQNEVQRLDALPYPDFGLLKYARKLRMYPLGRTRGCGMACEFCSVKGQARWASAKHFFDALVWLVTTRKARHVFIVDDRLEEDLEGTVAFFRMIAERFGNRLHITVQIRLEAARNQEFLDAMKQAGVRIVCIGYESPIPEELRAMRKGYNVDRMLEWTRVLRTYFWVHGMFIFGYPGKEGERSTMTAHERAHHFKRFIRAARLDSIQVLHPGPLVGTDLRRRLEAAGRIFPLSQVPWSRYDGNYACFRPDDMTLQELQEIPMRLMRWFYHGWGLVRVPVRTLLFPADFLVRGWRQWHRGWLREVVKYGGHRLLQKWHRKLRNQRFVAQLEEQNTEPTT